MYFLHGELCKNCKSIQPGFYSQLHFILEYFLDYFMESNMIKRVPFFSRTPAHCEYKLTIRKIPTYCSPLSFPLQICKKCIDYWEFTLFIFVCCDLITFRKDGRTGKYIEVSAWWVSSQYIAFLFTINHLCITTGVNELPKICKQRSKLSRAKYILSTAVSDWKRSIGVYHSSCTLDVLIWMRTFINWI